MPISALTFAELRHESFHGGDVPTLDETLACIDGRAVTYVEVKAPGIERLVLAELGSTWRTGRRPQLRSSRFARPAAPCRRIGRPGILSASYLLEPDARSSARRRVTTGSRGR